MIRGGHITHKVARGLDPAVVQAKTGAPLRVAGDCPEMDVPAAFNGVISCVV